MEEEKSLVEETTENVEEETTEENQIEEQGNTEESVEVTEEPKEAIKTFTKEEVDEMIAKKLARKEAKLRKEYSSKYGKLENVVNAGLGTDNTEDAITKLTEFYTSRGINIPDMKESYSDRDLEILANADADDVISLGYDDISEEIERLDSLGDKMSKKDKIIYTKLITEKKKQDDLRELSSIGVGDEILDSKEFIDFTKKLNPNLSIKEKYEIYLETKPKKEIKQMGSMKNTPVEKTLKDFYTRDEALRLTDDDYKKHPELYEIIERSMTKW